MPQAVKCLGQTALPAAADADVYTVPAATQTIVSSIAVCNRGAAATTFRLGHALAGAAAANAQWFYYDAPLPANATMVITIGLCMAATDMLRAQAAAATVTVMAWGEERS